MNQADINNQWHSLCNEYDEVKKRYFDDSGAFGAITGNHGKFTEAFGSGANVIIKEGEGNR